MGKDFCVIKKAPVSFPAATLQSVCFTFCESIIIFCENFNAVVSNRKSYKDKLISASEKGAFRSSVSQIFYVIEPS